MGRLSQLTPGFAVKSYAKVRPWALAMSTPVSPDLTTYIPMLMNPGQLDQS